MRIAVIGAGGIGGYFGGRLAEAGHQVVFIARGEHLRAMLECGLRVESVDGDFLVSPCEATDDPRQIGEVDVVLVGVKAWQVPGVAREMRPMVGERTLVLPLQNGVEAPRQLAEVLGTERVAGGLCRIVSERVAPGRIRHSGAKPYVAFGELDNRRSRRIERLREAFANAGVTVEVPADIQVAMWEKFLLIAAFSGVGSITRAPVGDVLRLPETRELLERALREIHAVARAHGVELADDVIARTMGFFEALPPESTASMQRDVMEGRPSELESQNGAVVRLGREAGVETPVHAFIYASLLPQERQGPPLTGPSSTPGRAPFVDR